MQCRFTTKYYLCSQGDVAMLVRMAGNTSVAVVLMFLAGKLAYYFEFLVRFHTLGSFLCSLMEGYYSFDWTEDHFFLPICYFGGQK